jgi:hypothetical protein
MKIKLQAFVVLFFILILFKVGSASAQTSAPSQTGGPGTAWGVSLGDFKTSKGSKTTFYVDKMNARPLDYLLMDFHEVDKNDPDRAPKCLAQTITGDDTLYLFYDGKFCASSIPLAPPDVMDTKHKLDSKYQKVETHTQVARSGFYGYYGSETVFFRHTLYAEDASTMIDLVMVSGYYDDNMYYGKSGFDLVQTEEGELIAGYLVYVSADYLKGPNAYTDWQDNRKNPAPPNVDAIQRFKCGIEH